MARYPKINNIKKSLPLLGLKEQRDEIWKLILVNILNTTELYTLNGSIVWYMNDVSIKLFKKRKNNKKYMYNLYAEISKILKKAVERNKAMCHVHGLEDSMLIPSSDSIDLMQSQLNPTKFFV